MSIPATLLDRIRGLRHRERRERDGLYTVEGRQALQAALAAGIRPIHLLLDPQARQELAPELRVADHVHELTADQLATISQVKLTEGVISVLPIRGAGEDELLACRRLILLEDVKDPANLAVILRSAGALGWDGLVVLGRGTDPWNPRAARACMGALHHLKLAVFREKTDFLRRLAAAGWTLAAMVVRGGRDSRSWTPTLPLALLAGNETRGLSDEARGLCSLQLSIAQAGQTESLNVAQAMGMLCYQFAPDGNG